MKKLTHFAFVLFFAAGITFVVPTVKAADPLKVAPEIYAPMFENESVRVMKFHFKPGAKIGEHSHPAHLIYVMKPGKLKIFTPDGKSKDLDAKTGEVLWSAPETHWAENVGGTDVEALIVELKSPPKVAQ